MPLNNATRLGERRPCSILDASEALPLSPTLSMSTLKSTGTSEEVPVFLFNSHSGDDIASESCQSPIVSSWRYSSLASSNSADTMQTTHTCATFGTFGQFRKPQHYNNPALSFESYIVGSSQATEKLNDDEVSLIHNSISESELFFSPSNLDRLHEVQAAPLYCTGVDAVSSPSPSPSVHSKSSSSRSGRSGSETRILYSDYGGNQISASPPLSTARHDSAVSLPGLEVSQPRHDRKASSASDSFVTQMPLPFDPPSAVSLSHPEFPQSLAWLKSTVVDLVIDQEGFRSITPSFRFAGFSTNTRSLDSSEKLLEGGSAQFIPISRQTFNFHYAPFDGQPVLRRISINGTSRDHVSRQATITLKSNGVYTVRGTETPLIHLNAADNDTEPSKLHWKLDYYVDNRKGKYEGEKTFTPLTFSCSPMLLHPLQGKKIRLMHVMKKSVVTKLVAEKMELPKATPSRPSQPSPSHALSPSPLTPRAHLWNLHRRFQSHGNSNTHGRSESSEARLSSPLGANRTNETHVRTQGLRRHRRASSAGDIDTSNSDGYRDGENCGIKGWNGSQMALLTADRGTSCDRHILPPSKLSELLENIEITAQSVQPTGLTPAPRRARSFAHK
ncbi:hypothetical protein BDP27DRAFT_1316078 [Rhodocollybia butyracea]|uniref:Uncharacterized protein n=1 Tax=Rhodocollybia butyracea TaxID=206335 RepID=A0A9P5UE29_9AGAR|nr:hypothetical protein BDP27DRAFT_1316078 [Rhodocollybia butyracea]